MNIVVAMDKPVMGEKYVSEAEGKKFIFQLISVEDTPTSKHNKTNQQEAPGFGCLRLKRQISDKAIEDAKKSFFKAIKL